VDKEKIDKLYAKGKQDKIAKIAKNTRKNSICMTALEKLDEQKYQEVFAEIAKDKTSNLFVRMLAVDKLDVEKYEELFVEIAKEGGLVGATALEKLDVPKHQEVFAEIAKNNVIYEELRKAALEKLNVEKNQDVFIEIVKDNQSRKELREAALERLDVEKNQDVFAEIAKNKQLKNFVRMESVKKLDIEKYKELFLEMAKDKQDESDVRIEALVKYENEKIQKLGIDMTGSTLKILKKYLFNFDLNQRVEYMDGYNFPHTHKVIEVYRKGYYSVHDANDYYSKTITEPVETWIESSTKTDWDCKCVFMSGGECPSDIGCPFIEIFHPMSFQNS
jgi:hypothetical protein